jgi:hypothetical protein
MRQNYTLSKGVLVNAGLKRVNEVLKSANSPPSYHRFAEDEKQGHNDYHYSLLGYAGWHNRCAGVVDKAFVTTQ